MKVSLDTTKTENYSQFVAIRVQLQSLKQYQEHGIKLYKEEFSSHLQLRSEFDLYIHGRC
jgi:hypothetical protein